jgi:glucose-1-phosphatase
VIRAVAFDFGNVLCRLERDKANSAMAAHAGIPPEEIGRRVWGGAIERDSETGRISASEHFERVKAAIGADGSWSYGEFAEEFGLAISPFPEGEAAVEGVAALGLRSFIVSNTNYIHSLKIFGREILATRPELYALSFKIGAMKPDPRIWLWLAERSGLSPAECLYVDDIEVYCAAARGLGFPALRYHFSSGNLLQAIEQLL